MRQHEFFRGKKRQTKSNSKNRPLEVSLAFHSKDIENIAVINDYTRKRQVPYTAVDPSERFYRDKSLILNVALPMWTSRTNCSLQM